MYKKAWSRAKYIFYLMFSSPSLSPLPKLFNVRNRDHVASKQRTLRKAEFNQLTYGTGYPQQGWTCKNVFIITVTGLPPIPALYSVLYWIKIVRWFEDEGCMLHYICCIHSIINNRSEPMITHKFLKFQWYLFSHSSLNTPPRALALIPGGNTHGIVGPPCFASDARRANPWNLPLSFTEKIKMTFLYLWRRNRNRTWPLCR